MVALVGPCLCRENYSSHNIHCHHPSSSEVWCTLEPNTAYMQVQRQGKQLREGAGEGVGETKGRTITKMISSIGACYFN